MLPKCMFAYIKDCNPALTNPNVKNVQAKSKEVVHLKFLIFTGSVATVNIEIDIALLLVPKILFTMYS